MSKQTPLAACPFCGGPPAEIVRDAVTRKPHYGPIPTGAGELDFYLQAFVFCHECGAQSGEIEEDIADAAGLEALEQKARDAWNTRDNRNHDLYLANLPIAPAGAGKISPVPVDRDQSGFWTHPQYPEPKGGAEYFAPGEFKAWLDSQGLQYCHDEMPEDQSITGDLDYGCAGWEPEPPEGEGWFIGSIHENDAGINCIWLRNVEGNHVS